MEHFLIHWIYILVSFEFKVEQTHFHFIEANYSEGNSILLNIQLETLLEYKSLNTK